jgi:hypothetical protein
MFFKIISLSSCYLFFHANTSKKVEYESNDFLRDWILRLVMIFYVGGWDYLGPLNVGEWSIKGLGILFLQGVIGKKLEVLGVFSWDLGPLNLSNYSFLPL